MFLQLSLQITRSNLRTIPSNEKQNAFSLGCHEALLPYDLYQDVSAMTCTVNPFEVINYEYRIIHDFIKYRQNCVEYYGDMFIQLKVVLTMSCSWHNLYGKLVI